MENNANLSSLPAIKKFVDGAIEKVGIQNYILILIYLRFEKGIKPKDKIYRTVWSLIMNVYYCGNN
jgi:hypothetical protein